MPRDWSQANVTPLFKSGRKSEAKTFQVSKLMETVIRDNMVQHLESQNSIRKSQHGFRGGRSCLNNLLTHLNKVTKWIDDGQPVNVLYLDYSKAFDKVAHNRLVN